MGIVLIRLFYVIIDQGGPGAPPDVPARTLSEWGMIPAVRPPDGRRLPGHSPEKTRPGGAPGRETE